MNTSERVKPLIGMTCRLDADDDWHYLPAEYSRAVAAAGGVPVLIPLIAETVSRLAAELDGFILCGSASDVDPSRYHQGRHPMVKSIHPERDETDFRVLEQAFAAKKPLLGICYGMQALNVFLRGTLIQHIPECVPGAIRHEDRRALHPIELAPESKLIEWADGKAAINVNSTHHQCVQVLGLGLHVGARSEDGIIEAVEGEFLDQFVVGVQWHPERIWKEEPLSARLFSELVCAARRRSIAVERAGVGVGPDADAL